MTGVAPRKMGKGISFEVPLSCLLKNESLNRFGYYENARAFGKAMSNNGAPSSYNPYPVYNSFCYHLREKINGLRLTEEVKLIAECRALLTSYDDFMFGLRMNQALHEAQERQYEQMTARLQASYEEKLGQLYLIAERMGITQMQSESRNRSFCR